MSRGRVAAAGLRGAAGHHLLGLAAGVAEPLQPPGEKARAAVGEGHGESSPVHLHPALTLVRHAAPAGRGGAAAAAPRRGADRAADAAATAAARPGTARTAGGAGRRRGAARTASGRRSAPAATARPRRADGVLPLPSGHGVEAAAVERVAAHDAAHGQPGPAGARGAGWPPRRRRCSSGRSGSSRPGAATASRGRPQSAGAAARRDPGRRGPAGAGGAVGTHAPLSQDAAVHLLLGHQHEVESGRLLRLLPCGSTRAAAAWRGCARPPRPPCGWRPAPAGHGRNRCVTATRLNRDRRSGCPSGRRGGIGPAMRAARGG